MDKPEVEVELVGKGLAVDMSMVVDTAAVDIVVVELGHKEVGTLVVRMVDTVGMEDRVGDMEGIVEVDMKDIVVVDMVDIVGTVVDIQDNFVEVVVVEEGIVGT